MKSSGSFVYEIKIIDLFLWNRDNYTFLYLFAQNKRSNFFLEGQT